MRHQPLVLCEIDITTHDNGGSVDCLCCHHKILKTIKKIHQTTNGHFTLQNSGVDQASISKIVCNWCLSILSHHYVLIILKQNIHR